MQVPEPEPEIMLIDWAFNAERAKAWATALYLHLDAALRCVLHPHFFQPQTLHCRNSAYCQQKRICM